MPSIHRDREPTYEQGDAGSGVAPVELGELPAGVEFEPLPEIDPDAEPVEFVSEPKARRRARGPRRPVVSAQAGHAGGAGEASGG